MAASAQKGGLPHSQSAIWNVLYTPETSEKPNETVYTTCVRLGRCSKFDMAGVMPYYSVPRRIASGGRKIYVRGTPSINDIRATRRNNVAASAPMKKAPKG